VRIALTQDAEDATIEQNLPGQQVRLYHGTAECAGHVRWLERVDDALIAQITLIDPAVAEAGDRFVIRYGDTGISGGTILLTARPRWLTRPKLLEVTQALVSSDYRKAVALFLDACPQRVVRPNAINCMLPQSIRQPITEKLLQEGSIQQLSQHLVTAESIQVLSTKLMAELTKASAKESTDIDTHSTARSLETLRGKVLPGIDRAVFQALVKRSVDSGALERKGDQLLLRSQKGAADKQSRQTELEEKLLGVLSEHWCLEIDELAKQVGQDKKPVMAALNQLGKEMKTTVINYEFAGLNSKVHDAHKLLAQIWLAKKDISPADFRDALGTSRKYAMALLAHFDDNGVTRRVANSRVLLKNPKAN
jgi:selenocysteine-specific elongation factor